MVSRRHPFEVPPERFYGNTKYYLSGRAAVSRKEALKEVKHLQSKGAKTKLVRHGHRKYSVYGAV